MKETAANIVLAKCGFKYKIEKVEIFIRQYFFRYATFYENRYKNKNCYIINFLQLDIAFFARIQNPN